MHIISYECRNGPGGEDLYLGDPRYAQNFKDALRQAEERVIENILIDLGENNALTADLCRSVRADFASARQIETNSYAGEWSAGESDPYEVAVSVDEVPARP